MQEPVAVATTSADETDRQFIDLRDAADDARGRLQHVRYLRLEEHNGDTHKPDCSVWDHCIVEEEIAKEARPYPIPRVASYIRHIVERTLI